MGDSTNSLIWVILGLPLAGSLVQALFGKRVIESMGPKKGRWTMGFLAVLPIAIAFILGVVITLGLSGQAPDARSHISTLGDWISISSIRIPFEALIDPLSMTMVLIITGIGSLIHLYSTGYMSEEQDYSRFFTYLNLFISCMLILVLANNLVLMFIGWEGVGLCSYLLIAFWYKDINNAKAGNKAFIVNRIGDWGLTLGMFLIFCILSKPENSALLHAANGRWLSYDVILPHAVQIFSNDPGMATAIALLLFVGACGKSAQFPLYFWLPDAMAGPTPVSALIHAATMVTAGVFLVNRMHVFYELSPVASAVVVCVGAFTALFAALIAFGQTDIKKVLAYSTVSQLGYMFIGCGAGAYWAGMFHVTTHAFFKACLFLGSGAVIHAMAHNQDMRNYGNLFKYLKITAWTMIIATLAIAGFPLLAGYWSKEAIIGAALGNSQAVVGDNLNLGVIAGWLALITAGLTAWYMTRLAMLTFFGGEERWRSIKPAQHHAHAHDHAEHAHHDGHAHEDAHGFFYTDEEAKAQAAAIPEVHHHELDRKHEPHEVPASMWLPLVVLAALSVVGGWALGHDEVFRNWLYPEGKLAVLTASTVPGEASQIPLKLYSMIAAFGGLIIGYLIYRKGLPKREGWDLNLWSPFRKSAANQFGFNDMLMNAGVEGGGELGNAIWKVFDVKIIDGIVNGLGALAMGLGGLFRKIQTGYVRNYAMAMTFGGLLILAIALGAYYKLPIFGTTQPAPPAVYHHIQTLGGGQ
ncbi:MAG TPA: NADH-quinone oxidoreductase subunit L [Fimbriimonadaceae bacterium]|jgi:NADH-quinone oxidoreductase subunit L